MLTSDLFLAQVHLILSLGQFYAEDELVTTNCWLSLWLHIVVPLCHSSAEALRLDFPCCRLTLTQIWSLEVSLAHCCIGVDRVEQVTVGAHVIIRPSHLLKFLARSIEKGFLDLESQLLEEVYFLIVEVLIVENGKLLHPCFHLCS